MPRQFGELTEYFDQTKIEYMERAIERAWQVLKQLDPNECTDEGRKVLSLCVMSIAREGEDNHLRLVNRAIVSFREQRARRANEARRHVAISPYRAFEKVESRKEH
jgi:hypothetical protein